MQSKYDVIARQRRCSSAKRLPSLDQLALVQRCTIRLLARRNDHASAGGGDQTGGRALQFLRQSRGSGLPCDDCSVGTLAKDLSRQNYRRRLLV